MGLDPQPAPRLTSEAHQPSRGSWAEPRAERDQRARERLRGRIPTSRDDLDVRLSNGTPPDAPDLRRDVGKAPTLTRIVATVNMASAGRHGFLRGRRGEVLVPRGTRDRPKRLRRHRGTRDRPKRVRDGCPGDRVGAASLGMVLGIGARAVRRPIPRARASGPAERAYLISDERETKPAQRLVVTPRSVLNPRVARSARILSFDFPMFPIISIRDSGAFSYDGSGR